MSTMSIETKWDDLDDRIAYENQLNHFRDPAGKLHTVKLQKSVIVAIHPDTVRRLKRFAEFLDKNEIDSPAQTVRP